MRPIVQSMIAKLSSTRHYISATAAHSRSTVASTSTNSYNNIKCIRNRYTVMSYLMDNKLPTKQHITIARLSGYTGRIDMHTRYFNSHAGQQKVDTNESKVANDEIEDAELMAEVQEANERNSGNIELKKVDGQWGVYTSRPYTKGSTVISSKAQSTSNISCSHSIQTDWNKYTLMDLPARFLNHSCGPNIGVRGDGLNGSDSYDFVPLRDIEAGEEVRFDYETTEWNVGAFEKCLCGSVECRGHIKGYRYSGDVVHDKYDNEVIAKYLRTASGRGTS